MEIQLRAVSAPAWECDRTDLTDSVSQTRRVEALSVVAVRQSGEEETLMEAELELTEWVDNAVYLHRSVGSYLSLEHRLNHHSVCGAHPSFFHSFEWTDLLGLPGQLRIDSGRWM